tara:strand:+ start:797 stop:973 length:177 start_codon:yes stop_codon:yes gene_type:complete
VVVVVVRDVAEDDDGFDGARCSALLCSHVSNRLFKEKKGKKKKMHIQFKVSKSAQQKK